MYNLAMTQNSEILSQLSELAVEITVRVADMLSSASKDMARDKRDKIDEMIQTNLPDVVINTIFKTTSLHSPAGVDHLKENVDYYATQIAQRFIKNDM
jgi:hydroxypyruvate isomerase